MDTSFPSAARRGVRFVAPQPSRPLSGSRLRPPRRSEEDDDDVRLDFWRLAGLVAGGFSIPLIIELAVRLFGLGP